MKKTNVLLIAGLVTGVSVTLLFGANASNKLFQTSAVTCSHVGYHYEAKAPTTTESGWYEYWVCCKCHGSFLTMPHGSFTTQDSSLMSGGAPDSSHVAYIAPGDAIAMHTSIVMKDHDADFKILTLTDIQMHDGEDINANLAVLDDTFNKANPDMVIFLGDLINDDATKKSVVNYKSVLNKIDSWEVPWAPIFGNHDYEDYHTAYESQKTTTHFDLINDFNSYDYCLYKNGPSTVNGSSNYLINIIDDETLKPVRSLVMMDSRLNGVTDSHADFYKDCSDYAKSLNDGNYVETIVCTHIPLPEYGDAYTYMQSVQYENVTGIVGRDPCDLAAGSHDVFAAIKEYGNCHNVICGHDHENAYWTMHDGVKLAYSMKSSYGDGHNKATTLGGAMYVISSTGTELEYVHSTEGAIIESDLAVDVDHIPYWRYSGLNLKFDIEYLSPSNSGTGKMSLMGTNLLRYGISEKDRLGAWNRLTGRVDFNGNRTVDIGTITHLEGDKYEYSLDVTALPLNSGSGEAANGEETLRMVYFSNFSSSNKVRVSNFRYVFENVTEENQFDLANATISSIGDQFYNFGQFVRPTVTVVADGQTLAPVNDILVKYSNNKEVGQATVTVVPSGKGAHRYKGYKTTTFNIVNNPDADTVPGHEDAIVLNTSQAFENSTFTTLPNWYNSGKSLYFEVKRLQNGTVQSGETVRFSLMGLNSNEGVSQPTSNWNRLTGYYTVNLSSHTVSNGSTSVGTVTDLGDGWYSYSIPLNAFVLNSGEHAMGNANETLTLIYFDQLTRSFKIDNLGVK